MAIRTEFSDNELSDAYEKLGLFFSYRSVFCAQLTEQSKEIFTCQLTKKGEKLILRILDPLIYYLAQPENRDLFMKFVNADEAPTVKQIVDAYTYLLKCSNCLGPRPNGSLSAIQAKLVETAIDKLTPGDLKENIKTSRSILNFGPIARVELLAVGMIFRAVQLAPCPLPAVESRKGSPTQTSFSRQELG